MSSRFLLIALIAMGAQSCSEPATAPPSSMLTEFVPASALNTILDTNREVRSLPAVRIRRLMTDAPVPGVSVVYTLNGPDGESRSLTVVSDQYGLAKLPAWNPSTIGVHTATAAAEGFTPIVFGARVRGSMVAIYDLDSIGGQPAQATFPSEGHYVLFEDGSYNVFYRTPVESFDFGARIDGTYTFQNQETLLFYIDPALAGNSTFYPSVGYRFSTGTIVENRLRVTYTDVFDFSDEVYVRR